MAPETAASNQSGLTRSGSLTAIRNGRSRPPDPRMSPNQRNHKGPYAGPFDGRYWARTSDPQLVELVLSQLS